MKKETIEVRIKELRCFIRRETAGESRGDYDCVTRVAHCSNVFDSHMPVGTKSEVTASDLYVGKPTFFV